MGIGRQTPEIEIIDINTDVDHIEKAVKYKRLTASDLA
jgi:hypothetical protein